MRNDIELGRLSKRIKIFTTIDVDKGCRGMFSSYISDILGKMIHIGWKIGRYCGDIIKRVSPMIKD